MKTASRGGNSGEFGLLLTNQASMFVGLAMWIFERRTDALIRSRAFNVLNELGFSPIRRCCEELVKRR
jgi:hypothetical protein